MRMISGNFFAELKRRNVYKVAVAYAIVAWLLIQVATQVFPFFSIPDWTVRLVVLLVVLGFPVALILAWAFEITPEGIKREQDVDRTAPVAGNTGRKLTAVIVLLATVAAGLMVFRFVRSGSGGTEGDRAARSADISSKSIAVLPFENFSQDKANAYFAVGI
ncbi:MAG: adenylyl cyclase, partial [Chthoniobacterales bacterium]